MSVSNFQKARVAAGFLFGEKRCDAVPVMMRESFLKFCPRITENSEAKANGREEVEVDGVCETEAGSQPRSDRRQVGDSRLMRPDLR